MRILKMVFGIVLFLACCCAADGQSGVLPKKDFALHDATADKCKGGAVWEYTARPGEEKSTLTIEKIGDCPELGLIVHIAVEKIKPANCHGGPSPNSTPPHALAAKALTESVAKKIAANQPLPDYREGYEEWKEAYLKRKAGIYVLGVSGAVSVAEKTYQSGIGCE
jgi:hypothetical protein